MEPFSSSFAAFLDDIEVAIMSRAAESDEDLEYVVADTCAAAERTVTAMYAPGPDCDKILWACGVVAAAAACRVRDGAEYGFSVDQSARILRLREELRRDM